MPQQTYAHAEETISDDAFKEAGIICADPEQHASKLKELVEMGATTVAIMNCSGADPRVRSA